MFLESYIGLVVPFAGKKEPDNWMFCSGQQLPISEYELLYSLIGTTYGGDDITTFALPNLCGRVVVHSGQALHMQKYKQGQYGGNEKVMITIDNLPSHNHELDGTITGKPPCSNGNGTTSIPTDNYPAIINGGAPQYSTSASDTIEMASSTISTTIQEALGGEEKQPVNVMSPFLAMNYIICIAGIYPSHG